MLKIYIIVIKILINIICFNSFSYAEPFVVLEYNAGNHVSQEASENPFLTDENYSSKHKVKKNETLTDIILKYYGFRHFNKDILSLSIVKFNKHAFVRKNPNFLFAEKTLYLPSLKEIKNIVIRPKTNKDNNDVIFSDRKSQIYFFGG